MLDETPDELLDSLGACLAVPSEILEAYLFGSQARGDSSQHSDLDVAVFVDDSSTGSFPYGYLSDLAADLVRALQRNDVDVVLLNRAAPLLYQQVLRDGVRILSRDLVATTAREGRALSRYCDYVPQLRKIDVLHADRIERGSFGR